MFEKGFTGGGFIMVLEGSVGSYVFFEVFNESDRGIVRFSDECYTVL